MPLSLQIETVSKWANEAMPLVFKHWQELGLDLDLKIDPDVQKMQLLEDAGLWSVITVRDREKMVGYVLAIISTHLHYKSSSPMLIVDAYYVLPEYRRGAGVRLFKYMEELAKSRGCIKIYLSCKVHRDHSKIFQGLGYKLSDYAFIKRI